MSGIYAVGVGGAMFLTEVVHGSDAVPNLPIHPIGRVVDELMGNEDLTAQSLGDLAAAVINLSKWGELSKGQKVNAVRSVLNGVYNMTEKTLDSSVAEKYTKQIMDIINDNNACPEDIIDDSCSE